MAIDAMDKLLRCWTLHCGPFVAQLGWRIGYIRLFGQGIRYKNTRAFPLLFSERNGHRPVWCVGHWAFGFVESLDGH